MEENSTNLNFSTAKVLSDPKSNEDKVYIDWYNWIGRTYPISILLFGTIGNFLNFIVVGRTCSGSSVGILLRSMALGNLLDIWLYIFPLWLEATINLKLRDSGPLSCKLIPYFSYSGTDFAIFLVVFSNFDRFVAIWFPFQLKKICTVRNAIIETIIALLLSLILNFSTLLTRAILPGGKCGYYQDSWLNYFQNEISPWVILISISIIPEASVIILNTLLIIGFTKHNRETKHMASTTTTAKKAKKENATYVLTIGVSILFIILYTPILLVRPFRKYFYNEKFYELLQIIFSMMQHTYHSTDFYIYLLISDSYRKKFIKVICLKKI